MPNWVENNFTATGLTPEQKQELQTNLEGNAFFANYIQEPDWENTPNEDGELPVSETLTFANGTTYTSSNFPISGKDDDRWYDWNIANFGCKWDIGEADVPDPEAEELQANFLSPWSPPIVGLQAVSQHYPEATFSLTYEEGCGENFAGVAVFRNGQCVERDATISYDFRYEWWEANYPDLYQQFVEAQEDEDADEDELREQLDCLWYDEGAVDALSDHLETVLKEVEAELDDEEVVGLSVEERVKRKEQEVADMHSAVERIVASMKS
jgi:hypothetical protein